MRFARVTRFLEDVALAGALALALVLSMLVTLGLDDSLAEADNGR